jgi:hypothetical protein
MRKPKRHDKNYTAAENREIRVLKGQGWSNGEIAQHMGRTEIGISRHWSNINCKPFKKTSMTVKDRVLITETMRQACAQLGFKKPFVNFYDDTRIGNGYGFKVHGGYNWPDRVWKYCCQQVQKLGYSCTLAHNTNYYDDNTAAHSRGIRIKGY